MSVDRPTTKYNGLTAKEHEAVKYKIHHLRNKGLSMRAIAQQVNLSEARVHFILRAKGGKMPPAKQYDNMPFNKSSAEKMMLQNKKKRGK